MLQHTDINTRWYYLLLYYRPQSWMANRYAVTSGNELVAYV
jgi:hypothetical protein